MPTLHWMRVCALSTPSWGFYRFNNVYGFGLDLGRFTVWLAW